jgi:hypothetical protein
MLSRNSQVMDWMREKEMRIDSNLWAAPLAVQLYSPIYMSSPWRFREALRKIDDIRKCPKLVQGIKKSV